MDKIDIASVDDLIEKVGENGPCCCFVVGHSAQRKWRSDQTAQSNMGHPIGLDQGPASCLRFGVELPQIDMLFAGKSFPIARHRGQVIAPGYCPKPTAGPIPAVPMHWIMGAQRGERLVRNALLVDLGTGDIDRG